MVAKIFYEFIIFHFLFREKRKKNLIFERKKHSFNINKKRKKRH